MAVRAAGHVFHYSPEISITPLTPSGIAIARKAGLCVKHELLALPDLELLFCFDSICLLLVFFKLFLLHIDSEDRPTQLFARSVANLRTYTCTNCIPNFRTDAVTHFVAQLCAHCPHAVTYSCPHGRAHRHAVTNSCPHWSPDCNITHTLAYSYTHISPHTSPERSSSNICPNQDPYSRW